VRLGQAAAEHGEIGGGGRVELGPAGPLRRREREHRAPVGLRHPENRLVTAGAQPLTAGGQRLVQIGLGTDVAVHLLSEDVGEL
jgi:hypothetical protein